MDSLSWGLCLWAFHFLKTIDVDIKSKRRRSCSIKQRKKTVEPFCQINSRVDWHLIFFFKIPIAAQILSCQMSAVNRKVIYPLAKFPSVVWITRNPSSFCVWNWSCFKQKLFRQLTLSRYGSLPSMLCTYFWSNEKKIPCSTKVISVKKGTR